MEETLKEIEKLIKRARQYAIKHDKAEGDVFELLYRFGIEDPEYVDSDAPNSPNLGAAISTYIAYGEYTIKDLIEEIRNAINKNE